jgi:formate-dependent nitrite reductase membrane component NrfD
MKLREIAIALLLVGLTFADLVIPPDQPICRLYGMIQILGTVGGILVAAYSGFTLASSHDMIERNNSKALLGGVIIGLIIIWLAPILVRNLVNSSGICGW